jgi:probable phosphoglycerate mutase
MIKKIYLVRHGRTEANTNNTIQDLSDPLVAEGVAQAEALGERLSHVPFDALIASDAVRARHTAEKIGEKTGHVVETTPLFRELSRPSAFVGIMRTDPRVLPFYIGFELNADDPSWRFADEETFGEARDRALAALDFLASRPEETLTVVTHGNFKRFLLGAILFGEKLTYREWSRLARIMNTSNTGVSVLQLENDAWKVMTWNDYAHLAE